MSDFDPGAFREMDHPPLPPEAEDEPGLAIELEDGRAAFRPGETVTGVARWDLDEKPTDVVLRLFWFTEGRGTRDVGVVVEKRFEAPGREDRRTFQLRLPEGPYSFSGKLISLIWALELVADPGDRTTRRMLTVGPDRHEVTLGSVSGEDDG
jgi:hypothetical protein